MYAPLLSLHDMTNIVATLNKVQDASVNWNKNLFLLCLWGSFVANVCSQLIWHIRMSKIYLTSKSRISSPLKGLSCLPVTSRGEPLATWPTVWTFSQVVPPPLITKFRLTPPTPKLNYPWAPNNLKCNNYKTQIL